MPEFHVRVVGDDMVFSAAHFITLPGGECERLHGHSYRAAAEVFGPLDENHCVVDYLAICSALKAIVAELDHRVLLPSQHPAIRVRRRAGQIEVRFAQRRWAFPEDDCLLLPMANTTTELLAQYVGGRLLDSLAQHCGASPRRARIEISEGTGCSAVCEMC
jgi:6-pyruvoyltetrahydropterin/6-carboxytetrahydropterin synthase